MANVHRLVADDAHDLSLDEMMALVAIQERMEKSFISGNTNLAINDRFQDLDIENWLTLLSRDSLTAFPLSTCFNMRVQPWTLSPPVGGLSIRRNFSNIPPLSWQSEHTGTLLKSLFQAWNTWIDVIHEMESQLQLGIRNRVMGVVMRTRDEARAHGPDPGEALLHTLGQDTPLEPFQPANQRNRCHHALTMLRS